MIITPAHLRDRAAVLALSAHKAKAAGRPYRLLRIFRDNALRLADRLERAMYSNTREPRP